MNAPLAPSVRTSMLVNALEKEETRIAIVVDGRLEDYHVERSSRETLVGNIYKGRVENVHASLQAAFVSIGLERNSFLHVSEVHGPGESGRMRRPGRGPRPKRLIQDLLKEGREVLVQVIRDEFGEKGPSVTMELGLPGRFLVLTPLSETVGVSKKIEDPKQRTLLRGMMREISGDAHDGVGFIIRTAGAETDPQDLKADYEYLRRVWESISQKGSEARPPALLYEESDIDLRAVRDYFTPDMEEVVVDSGAVYDRLVGFFEGVMPRYRERLKLYEGTAPLFHVHGIEAQVDQLNQKSVPLPSGGSIVIEQTEAMTAIDVNSGRLVREASPEDLAVRTNLEAAREVMRQLRLRDVGGVIVVDFIDLKHERNRRRIESELRDESRRDRAQTVILPMSAFCLAQIARQKIRPSVAAVAHDPCPACGGTGLVKSIESTGLEVMRALKSTLDRGDIATVEVRVGPEVFALLEARKAEIQEMELKYRKRIRPSRVRDQPDHRVEITCYSPSGDKVVDIVR